MTEAILEPGLPIVDAHHHLWGEGGPSLAPRKPGAPLEPAYLLPEFLADLCTGHNVRATVFIEGSAMYRPTGPEPLRSVGETEYAASVAAATAAGPTRVCAAIVGQARLSMGEAVAEVLEAHIEAAGGRFRGVRDMSGYDPAPAPDQPRSAWRAAVFASAKFREGFARLAAMGLTFDCVALEPQLAEAVDLVRAFPEATIIVNHVGGIVGTGAFAGSQIERLPIWRQSIKALAGASPNVVMKLGGLGWRLPAMPSYQRTPRATSEELAREWLPFVEPCIEAFGPDRCMFESNFPVDQGSGDYAVIWNAFKRLAQGYSASEKADLFSGTASRVYRLEA